MAKASALCLLTLVTLVNLTVALRFVTSPSSRPTALYTAPASYSASGRMPLSSVIITSAPLTVFNATAGPMQWRRHDAPPESVPTNSADPSKPSSQQLLDAFMKEYTASLKNPKQPIDATDRNNDRNLLGPPAPANRLANLDLAADTGDVDVATPVDVGDGDASWDLVPAEKHNHPYDDREGWVTLEPVPWSSSKVSKWHSQHPNGNKYPSSQHLSWLSQKPSSQDQAKPYRPSWEKPPSYWDDEKPSKPSWEADRPKPWESKPHSDSPYKPWHSDDKKPWQSDRPAKPSSWESDRPSKPTSWESERPSKPSSWESDRPSKPTSWDDKPYKPASWENDRPTKPTWESDRPSKPSSWDEKPSKPSSWDSGRPKPWDRPSKPTWAQDSKPNDDQSHQGSSHRPSSWSSHHSDIITDGASQPWPSDGHHRPQASYDSHTQHSHPSRPGPEEGPGEWVLLSTTKGYSVPSRRQKGQRALTVSPPALTATRSVRLIVLPALNGSTTSHGGMIEVEKTTLTVDESQEEDRKSRLLALRPALPESSSVADASSNLSAQEVSVAPLVLADAVVVADAGNATSLASLESQHLATPSAVVKQPIRGTQVNRRNAMLAAVGAGMVPATMALLVPMMLGRKKRSVIVGRRFEEGREYRLM